MIFFWIFFYFDIFFLNKKLGRTSNEERAIEDNKTTFFVWPKACVVLDFTQSDKNKTSWLIQLADTGI